MATKGDLIKELDWITEKISSQVWTLNLGTLGTTWSLLIASNPNIQFTPRNALWIVVPCLLSLLCELAQYLAGYWLDNKLLDKLEEDNETEFQYPKNSVLYRARKRWFFRSKIVLTILAAVILVFTLVRKFA
jgi:hypothetical protein